MPTKAELLSIPVEHVNPTTFDARPIVDAYAKTAFQARNLARACGIVDEMVADTECTVILTLAGSLISAGMKKSILTLLENNMVDVIVSSGANIVDQDFFEAIGNRHYVMPWSPEAPAVDDKTLRSMMIDRIYDTLIDEEALVAQDDLITELFDGLEPGAYSSRQITGVLGSYINDHHRDAESILLTAFRKGVPIFIPAASDCSAGFAALTHLVQREQQGGAGIAFDVARDFHELANIKLASTDTGILMLGGGVPKNFVQDIVVGAEFLVERGLAPKDSGIAMHKYAVQITVADVRDGALSGSTLREACSWGKVDVVNEQMVFGEVTTMLPILVSDAYHRGSWKARKEMRYVDLLERQPASVV